MIRADLGFSISRFQLAECPQIKTLRIDGSIFFGAADHIQKTLIETSEILKPQTHLILMCNVVNFIDVAGAEMLLQESSRMKKEGDHLHFCALKNTVKDELSANHYLAKLGREGELIINKDFKYEVYDYHLSTIKHKDVILQFNEFKCDSGTRTMLNVDKSHCDHLRDRGHSKIGCHLK